MDVISKKDNHLVNLVERLTKLSIKNKINPAREFDWPESLSEDTMWMPEELMTIYGTEVGSNLSKEEKIRLSKTEALWFYSFNVHGERHLLRDVLDCMHTPGYEPISDYMHHFVGEENVHSWFFATFCKKYGGRVYEDHRISFNNKKKHPDIESFYLFSRILILEELLDYYNVIISEDETMPPIIRKINHVHHYEESRHVAFGRSIVSELFLNLIDNHPKETIEEAREYIEKYMKWCIDSLYNPVQYQDARISDPYGFRRKIMKDSAREIFHIKLASKIRNFFNKKGILKEYA